MLTRKPNNFPCVPFPCDVSTLKNVLFGHGTSETFHVALNMPPVKLKIDNRLAIDVSRPSGVMNTFVHKKRICVPQK